MNLARRLAPIFSHISGGILGAWRFKNLSAWTLSNDNLVARLNSGATTTWQQLGSTGSLRSSSDGKYYYEVKITKHNVGDSQALRIGISDESVSNFYLFSPRGVIFHTGGSQAYMESGHGSTSVFKWGVGDVIGCSIEPRTGGGTNIRFYINGIDAGLSKNPLSIATVRAYIIHARGYRSQSVSDIELAHESMQYLPSGFEPW